LDAFLQQQRPCPQCGQCRPNKGSHSMTLRTLFGTLPVRVPACASAVVSAIPPRPAARWPQYCRKHTLPELLFLRAKWAALMSYGLSAACASRRVADRRTIARRNCATISSRWRATGGEPGEESLGGFLTGCPLDWPDFLSRMALDSRHRRRLCPRSGQARMVRGHRRQEYFALPAGRPDRNELSVK